MHIFLMILIQQFRPSLIHFCPGWLKEHPRLNCGDLPVFTHLLAVVIQQLEKLKVQWFLCLNNLTFQSKTTVVTFFSNSSIPNYSDVLCDHPKSKVFY